MTLHEQQQQNQMHPNALLQQMSLSSSGGDPDSDTEDDPGQLLNVWLGQLNTLKKDLDGPNSPNGTINGSQTVLRRKPKPLGNKALQHQYRCSLINLENTQDEELDAILDELNVLGSQFDEEIAVVDKQMSAFSAPNPTSLKTDGGPTKDRDVSSESNSSGVHSRSSSGGSVEASRDQSQDNNGTNSSHATSNGQLRLGNGARTDSPDNDSAFCDNLSVLSSCSASSSSRTYQSKSSSGISSTTSPTSATSPDQEARIKAEKMKLAIEKIKEASIKKLFIKVFTADGSAKSLLIDERMSVGHVTRILAEKNHVKLDPKWTLVELVPDLYMERVYEDHENLVENCLMWNMDSKNTLWFIERPEKFDLFVRPELYLLGTSSSQRGELMEEHSRQELLEEYFSSSGVGAPELEGQCWLKSESKKAWKKYYFVLRSSGLYYAPKDGKKSSKDLVCLSTFDVNQVYYGAGWKKKYKSPSDYCFAIKHPQIQAKAPKYIKYLCVDTEKEMHQWVTGIRIAKNARQLFDNYRAIEEEITMADIDLLTSKRYSVNSPNSLQIPAAGTNNRGLNPISGSQNDPSSPARTPSSENKSLDSALSSGLGSDMFQSSMGGDSACSSTLSFQESSETSSSQNTPVNTIERGGLGGTLRRSLSRASKSSSSSGCLSDKSSLPGGPEQGFESDFPAGGTIKKRPTVSPRIPLTSTTWGMVRDSDEDSNDPATPNVRVGGGGTLLRSAVRQSLRKHQRTGSDLPGLFAKPPPVPGHTIMAEVHPQPINDLDPLSVEFESSFGADLHDGPAVEDLPLPPPPRDESLDRLNQSAIDDLPPPPPELILECPYQATVARPPLPPQPMSARLPPSGRAVPSPLPPSLKRNIPSPVPSPKRVGNVGRRISFDDHVQLIGESPSFQRAPCPSRLYPDGAQSEAAPPKEFLNHLQCVMNKKWQIAEKCRMNTTTTPHQVLGFRDEVQHLVGAPQDYDRDDSVGAWVLQSQQFAGDTMNEPLYAIASKNAHPNQTPSHYAPSQGILPQPSRTAPVILREPSPEDDPYSTLKE
eukprot:maker-scaffold799_size95547-snap-gene-0.8 protein:Tk10664 transcript:maker-scaffold799_size95547-snap-gene-0.8-mRNA-1 annotation:"amyloid beta a4 precursor protein-binding family b member 1-interacting protein isoform x3"